VEATAVQIEAPGNAGWQSSAEPCPLCGERRRDYLFVVGPARVTRCHECGLVSRSKPPSEPWLSYALDPEVDATIREGLAGGAKRRVLEVVSGSEGGLTADPRLEVVRADDLEKLEAASFDAAFLNGTIESTPDPRALLKQVRRALKPGAPITVIAGQGDVLFRAAPTLERTPRHVHSPQTLIRLAHAAGFKPIACGLLTKQFGKRSRDARLAVAPSFGWTKTFLAALGRDVESSSGLLELRAVAIEGPPAKPKVSIILPVFNEARTFNELFDRVEKASIEGVDREIVIVESNSNDGSRDLVKKVEARPGVKVVYEDRPRGKGHAVRAGFAAASGDLILIQDADLEYDTGDYDIVLEPLLHLSATFVLGSRHLGARSWKIRQFAEAKLTAFVMNLAHEFFTGLVNRFYAQELRDPTTMYKVFRRECIEGIAFRRDRFDFDWELLGKLIRRGHQPIEVPINYRSRSYSEGKKVRFFRDPITWFGAIIGSRFEPLMKKPPVKSS
jgi:hypothetical protein